METNNPNQSINETVSSNDLNIEIDRLMSNHNEIKVLILTGIIETDNKSNPKVFTSIKVQESEIDNNLPDVRTETGLSLKDIMLILKFTDKGYIQEIVSKLIDLSQYFLNMQLAAVQEACKINSQSNINEQDLAEMLSDISNQSKAESDKW